MNAPAIAFIFARGGSKGVLRKNIRLLAGRPMIAYAIEVALQSELIDRVVVSTDDPEIAEVAKACGAEVPFLRPAHLATDDSPEWLSCQHAIHAVHAADPSSRLRLFVGVPVTSPLRTVEDLDAAIRAFDPATTDAVITVRAAQRNPYFNMMRIDRDGYARIVLPPSDELVRRQAAPAVFDITTVAYVAAPEYVLTARSFFQGRVRAVEVPVERAIDIDSELDLEIAEFLMQRAKRLTAQSPR